MLLLAIFIMFLIAMARGFTRQRKRKSSTTRAFILGMILGAE